MRRVLLTLVAAPLLLAGCRLENLTPEQIGMVTRSISATVKAARPISDEEEYYVGRAVAVRILATFPILRDRKLTDYVNAVGQAVALHSDKPFTHGGYHFAILDRSEINAFACPGGTILITRGMVSALRNEDELAAVLAHEVAHINHRDGIEAIQKSRWTEALTIIGTEAAKTYGSQDVARLVGIFEGSIDDVFKALVVNGYGKTQEYSADQTAMLYLARAGYDPRALLEFLNRLVAQGKGAEGGVLKTHPATGDRIENVKGNLPDQQADPSLVALRARRFSKGSGR